MKLNFKTLLFIVGLAVVMTFIGLPFGAIMETRSTAGTIGIDHHVWVTFLLQKLFDLGSYGHPGAILHGYTYAFALNFIVAMVIVMLVWRKET